MGLEPSHPHRPADAARCDLSPLGRGEGVDIYPLDHRTPASFFKRSISSAGEATRTPARRPGGSATLTTDNRGVTSTPRSAGVFSSIGFFFAIMMLGSEAYRGSLRRRSVVTTAGSVRRTVS